MVLSDHGLGEARKPVVPVGCIGKKKRGGVKQLSLGSFDNLVVTESDMGSVNEVNEAGGARQRRRERP